MFALSFLISYLNLCTVVEKHSKNGAVLLSIVKMGLYYCITGVLGMVWKNLLAISKFKLTIYLEKLQSQSFP